MAKSQKLKIEVLKDWLAAHGLPKPRTTGVFEEYVEPVKPIKWSGRG